MGFHIRSREEPEEKVEGKQSQTLPKPNFGPRSQEEVKMVCNASGNV